MKLISIKPLIIITACIFLLTTAALLDLGPYFYVFFITVGLAAVVFLKSNGVYRLMKWSKYNSVKAIILISFLQICLMLLGLITGINLQELGIEISNVVAYSFVLMMMVGFMFVPFTPKKHFIAIPHVLKRQRFFYMIIMVSNFILLVYGGNKAKVIYPNTIYSELLVKADQLLFGPTIYPLDLESQDISETISSKSVNLPMESNMMALYKSLVVLNKTFEPGYILKKKKSKNVKKERRAWLKMKKKTQRKAKKEAIRKAKLKEKRMANRMTLEKKRNERLQKRRTAAAISGAGAVIIIILLLIPLCAGICIAVMAESAAAALGGVLLAALSIYLMVKTAQATKSKKNRWEQ